jgi:hypothetical protein
VSEFRSRLTLQPPRTKVVGDAMDFFRESIIRLGEDIEAGLPHSRERSLALTALEETCFWTIATCARYQDVVGQPTVPDTPQEVRT